MVRALLRPRMVALHIVAVLAVVATVLLGRWQYGAWQHGREDQAAARVDVAPKPLNTVLTSDEPFPGDAVGQPVRVTGRWLPRSTVYVSDRTVDGRRGVWVVTPVAVCGRSTDCRTAPAVLVVRGWAPRVADAPAAPSGAVRLTGWLQPGEGSGAPDPDPSDNVLPELGIADALQHVDQDLYGGFVIAKSISGGRGHLTAVTPSSLPKASATTSLRNLLYALEWWVFGGFAVYAWWRWCRDEVGRVTGVPSSA